MFRSPIYLHRFKYTVCILYLFVSTALAELDSLSLQATCGPNLYFVVNNSITYNLRSKLACASKCMTSSGCIGITSCDNHEFETCALLTSQILSNNDCWQAKFGNCTTYTEVNVIN